MALFCVSAFALRRHSVAGRPLLDFTLTPTGNPEIDQPANAFQERVKNAFDAINQEADAPRFMDIPKAKPSDFKKATQRVYRGADGSQIKLMVVE
jgi:hypothetical protein